MPSVTSMKRCCNMRRSRSELRAFKPMMEMAHSARMKHDSCS